MRGKYDYKHELPRIIQKLYDSLNDNYMLKKYFHDKLYVMNTNYRELFINYMIH